MHFFFISAIYTIKHEVQTYTDLATIFYITYIGAPWIEKLIHINLFPMNMHMLIS